ncbi:MAG: LOG family protein [Phycisphaerae bacterium]|nr:LOG family protein [Phycisphaerae bacterium]
MSEEALDASAAFEGGKSPRDRRRSHNPERDAAIAAFVERWAPGQESDLLEQMIVTICRLAGDRTGRGELKIINSALRELRYAFKVFAPYQDVRKVTIFGSSRTPAGHPEYQAAMQFARRICEKNWMVITGAGDGIMGAGHDGAGRESSFGVAIRLPFEQQVNTIIADDPKLITFRYFFTRKLLFVKEASAIALFPGGFGTQDEGFEALTLIQTGKAPIQPIVLIDAPNGTYWQHWRTYVVAELLRTGMISPEDMNLFRVTDDVDAAVYEVTHFYSRYHSMRFVKNLLVLRLESPLSETAIEQLNDTFGDLLASGRFEQQPGPLPDENNAFPARPRLVFAFNNSSYGRLRLLINAVNDADGAASH